MEQQELFLLITRHFNEQTVPWEEDFLAEWLESAPENQQTYNELKEIWQSSHQQHDEVLVATALQDVRQRIRRYEQRDVISVFRKYRTQIVAAAAVTGVIAGSMFFLSQSAGKRGIAYVEKRSMPGQVLKDTMPDGTIVHLAPKSSIRYAKDFGSADRNIILEGEAFFDVTKDAHRPFTVKAGALSVQVLGTRFNVIHYNGADSAAVSLVDGKVQVSVASQPQPFDLQPGQELYYNKQEQKAYTRDYDVAAVTGWTTRMLVFRNDPLLVVARKLEQLYNVEISFADPVIANYKLFATFEDKPLNYILEVIKATDDLDYTVDGQQIRFTTGKIYQSR